MEIPYTIDDSKKKASLDMQGITDAVKEQSKREKEKQKHQKNVHIKYGDLQNPYLYNMAGFIERFSHIGYGQSVADVDEEFKQRQRGDASKISGKVYSQNNMRPYPNKPSPTIYKFSRFDLNKI